MGFAGGRRTAIKADDAVEVSVQLDHVAGAGGLVQAVDVLGDDAVEVAAGLESRDSSVSVVRVGSGDGAGFTVNLPVPGGSGDVAYRSLVEHVACALIRSWEPELVLISAGFDAHRDDPLATH